MLATLHIENVAVVKELDIDFSEGFNVLTGETGSGKSVIISSIGMLLGNPFPKDMIRSGEREAMISGYFTDISDNNKRMLSELGIDTDGDGGLFVQRNVTDLGRCVSRIGGRTVPASLQREAVGLLCDIHGQQDNHKLLDEKNHLRLLDSYCDNSELLEDYDKQYKALCETERKLKEAKESEIGKQERLEFLRYRIEELSKASLTPGEDEELEARLRLLRDAEKTVKQVNIIYRALYSNEKGASAVSLIEMAKKSLEAIGDVLPEASEYITKLDSFASEIQDIAEVSAMLTENIGKDPKRELDEVQARLGFLSRLQKKYGGNISDLLRILERSEEELDKLESSDLTVKELTVKREREYDSARKIAKKLHNRRCEYAKILEKLVVEQLEFLDMKSVKFICEFSECELNSSGFDKVRFLLSANKGEEAKSLSKTASGGELARIMLGIKSVFAEKEYTQTLIYDEIDTGISGKTSQKLGLVLKKASENAQIICITHSAQIAAAANCHFLISKSLENDRVMTSAAVLTDKERVSEIARIMGGNKISGELLSSAEQLISETQNQ